jgi:tetratricopeptide (TPR) repeat protein
MASIVSWLISRVGVIYIIALIFILTCMDIKTIQMRIKLRHLNDAIPDFSDMILFSRTPNAKNDVIWRPYHDYFGLILQYIPDDLIVKDLLGYVDYYKGQETKAIELFKASAVLKNQNLFWPNYNLGVIYYTKGQWAQAAQYLFGAVSSNFHLTLLLMQNSMVYQQISLSPFFKYSFDDEIKGAQAYAYVLLLSSLYNMKQYEKVIVIANLGLANQQLSYKDAFYYYEGLACLQLEKIKEALLFFQKSLDLEKNNPDVYYYLADLMQRAGQLQQAQQLLQVSLALHQKNDPRFPYGAQAGLRFF